MTEKKWEQRKQSIQRNLDRKLKLKRQSDQALKGLIEMLGKVKWD